MSTNIIFNTQPAVSQISSVEEHEKRYEPPAVVDTENNVYTDSDGNPCSVETLCRKEPYWAANRIKKLTEELQRSNGRVAELKSRTFAMAYGASGVSSFGKNTIQHQKDLLKKQAEKIRELESVNQSLRAENEQLHLQLSHCVPRTVEEQAEKIRELEQSLAQQTDAVRTYQSWVEKLQRDKGYSDQPMNPEWLKQKSKIEEQAEEIEKLHRRLSECVPRAVEEQATKIKELEEELNFQKEAAKDWEALAQWRTMELIEDSAVAEAPGVTRPVLHVQSQYDLDE